MASRTKVLILALAIILVIVSIAHTIHTIATCEGTVVRGVISYECFEEARRG